MKVTLGQQRERVTKGLVLVNTKLLVRPTYFFTAVFTAPMEGHGKLKFCDLDNCLGLNYFGLNHRLSFRYQGDT
jgi:hypothetical protein